MYCTIVILCLECFHCYVIIIDCLLTSFDILYFWTDGCTNYLLTLTHINFQLVSVVSLLAEEAECGVGACNGGHAYWLCWWRGCWWWCWWSTHTDGQCHTSLAPTRLSSSALKWRLRQFLVIAVNDRLMRCICQGLESTGCQCGFSFHLLPQSFSSLSLSEIQQLWFSIVWENFATFRLIIYYCGILTAAL